MRVTIYADTLVFLNTFVTYFLLMSTQLLCRRPPRRLRVLAASVFGGLYALSILFEPLPPILSFAVRAAVCILLRLIADGFRSLRMFLKSVLVFLLLNGLFAGIMLLCRLFVPQLLFANGIVYLDVRIPYLLLSTCAIYLCIRLVTRLFAARPARTHIGTVTICVGDRSVTGNGIFDTGNHLSDGFTGKPVLIVRPAFVRPLLPQGVADFLDGKELSGCSIPNAWHGRLRLFPYSSLGNDGLLPAFRCDRVVVSHLSDSCIKEKLYIAAAPRQLYHGETDALFPAALYDEITEGAYRHENPYLRQNTPPAFASSRKACIGGTLHQRSADASAAADETGRGERSDASVKRRRSGARRIDRT